MKMNMISGILIVLTAVSAMETLHSDLRAKDLDLGLYERGNLVAWCIVPWDAMKRNSVERAAMLKELGLSRFAYGNRFDYLEGATPQWDEEIEAMKRHGIEITAWWFPRNWDKDAEKVVNMLGSHGLSPQLWVYGGGDLHMDAEESKAYLQSECERIALIALGARSINSKVGLYGHAGWFGEPENQIAIIERLRSVGIYNVGIVYNFHHAHAHIDRFDTLMETMKPYLIAINLNGMMQSAGEGSDKIKIIGRGEQEKKMIRIIAESGWIGPVGILDHTNSEDSRVRLAANINGLEEIVASLSAK